MKKLETLFKDQVRRQLSQLPYTVALKIQQVAIRGTPDFLLCVSGWFVGLELKSSAQATLSALQRRIGDQILRAGGLFLVAYPENWDEVYLILKKLAMGERKHDPFKLQ